MDELEQVKAAVAECGPKGPGRRIPAAVRASVVRLAKSPATRAMTQAALAAELDVSTESLRRWARKAGEKPELVRVRVGGTGGGNRLTVTSPSGFRVEGLDLEAAATLLRLLS